MAMASPSPRQRAGDKRATHSAWCVIGKAEMVLSVSAIRELARPSRGPAPGRDVRAPGTRANRTKATATTSGTGRLNASASVSAGDRHADDGRDGHVLNAEASAGQVGREHGVVNGSEVLLGTPGRHGTVAPVGRSDRDEHQARVGWSAGRCTPLLCPVLSGRQRCGRSVRKSEAHKHATGGSPYWPRR